MYESLMIVLLIIAVFTAIALLMIFVDPVIGVTILIAVALFFNPFN